jgi:dipeptidyl aminopeptidase/acylaminoacyl peptidase
LVAGWSLSDQILTSHLLRIIDSEWQYRDADSAWNYLLSEPGVDASRCGVWGSSFGGGYALTLAGRDPRVKCIVIQIAAVNAHANWINRHPQYRGEQAIRDLAAKHARGEVYPWHLSKPKGLDGMPNLPKTVFDHTRTVLDATKDIRSPVMLLAAQNEETFHNSKNSDLIHNMLKDKVPTDFDYLPGTHYDAYDKAAYTKGVGKALDWFRTYLGDHEMLAKAEAEKAAAAQKAKEAAAAQKPKEGGAKL